MDGLRIMLETVLPQEMWKVCQRCDSADRHKYYYIRIADGKAWLFPRASSEVLKAALAIFQPVALKGRGFKRLFPYFASSRIFRKLVNKYIQVIIVDINLRTEFMDWVEEVFQVKEPIVSFYLGYQNVNRKSTCQVIDKKYDILGYIKFADEINSSSMIRVEADFLEHYGEKLVGIPERLDFRNELLGLTILAVTTIKTRHNSREVNILSQQHMGFLQQLREKTIITMNYRDTRYYLNQQEYLDTVLNNTAIEDGEIIRAAADIIERRLGDAEVAFSMAHRDFKPSNICFADGQIMVFDWELYVNEYPPFYDLFDFVTLGWRITRMPADKFWVAVEDYIATDLVTLYPDYTQDALELYFLMYQMDRTLLLLSLEPGSSIHNETAIIEAIAKSHMYDS